MKGLQPGTSYAFRVRAFNGYGPGEFTYKVLTTRPAKPARPQATAVTADAVTLRWLFPPLFLRRAEELRQLFAAADHDGSGVIDRAEFAAALAGRSGGGRGQGSGAVFADVAGFLRQRAKSLGLQVSVVVVSRHRHCSPNSLPHPHPPLSLSHTRTHIRCRRKGSARCST